MKHSIALAIFGATASAATADGVARKCSSYPFPEFVCMHRYGSVLPLDFVRTENLTFGQQTTYGSTLVPNDPSFSNVANATFLVWDEKLAQEILGENPVYEFMFKIDESIHEAPVYVPDTNELFFSKLKRNWLAQYVVDFNNDPPTLSQKTASPPIYAPTGARYRDGLIYFAVGGGNASLEGHAFRPGIYSLDPKTMESKAVVNNYYGHYFNLVDDLDIDAHGNIWFTDNLLARNAHINTEAPQIGAATYRFSPRTGAVSIVDDTLQAPNGLAFSPPDDGRRTLYLTDTGAGVPMIDPRVPWQDVPGIAWNGTRKRTVYAYDVVDDENENDDEGKGSAAVAAAPWLKNKRPIYAAMEYVPDGLKVAANGYVLAGTGKGVDVLEAGSGRPVLRVQTNFTAVNFDFVGEERRDELWIVGQGGVARVKWNLTGPVF
ncbi:lactonohydrolase [Lasiodiplodia theobromae]|nr:lactonohydrolase [Lasiodiplodia theobromae]